MRLTQESQLDNPSSSENVALGWMIDSAGRYWHGGGGGGFRSFIGFDVKTKRGVVVLAATNLSPLDTIGRTMYEILDGTAKEPPVLPGADALAALAGKYELMGNEIQIVAKGKHLYIEGGSDQRKRIVAFAADLYWIEAFQSLTKFVKDDTGKVTGVQFNINGRQIAARRLE
jgi:hypothetical protein